MEFLIMVDFFSIFLLKLEVYRLDRFQKLSLINWVLLLTELYIFGTHCQIKFRAIG